MDRIIEVVVALLVAVGSGAPATVPAGPPDEALAGAEARVVSVFEHIASLQEHVAAAVAWARCVAGNATSAPVPREPGFDPTDGCDFDKPAAGEAGGAGPVGEAPPVTVPAGPPADVPSGPPDPVPAGPPAGVPPEVPGAPEDLGGPPAGVPESPDRP
jgi:hypothetical protein